MGKVYISNIDFFNNLELYESIDIKIGLDEDNIIYEKYGIKFNNDLTYDFSFYVEELLHNILPDTDTYYCAVRINTISYTTPWYIVKEDKQKVIWCYKQRNKYNYKLGKYPILSELYDVDGNLILSNTYDIEDKVIDISKYTPVIDLDFKSPYDILRLDTVHGKINKTLYIDGLYDYSKSKLELYTRQNNLNNLWYSTKLQHSINKDYNLLDILLDVSELNNNEFVIELNDTDMIRINKNEIKIITDSNVTNINIDTDIFTLTFDLKTTATNVYLNYKLVSVILKKLDFTNIVFYIDNISNQTSKVYLDWLKYYKI